MSTKSISKYYKVRDSTGDAGQKYESKLTALFALRLYRNSQDFNLATNFVEGGDFDDIVFSAKRNEEWSTTFMQLKHKPKTVISVEILKNSGQKDKDFVLSKYFNAYEKIDKSEKWQKDEDYIFKNKIKASFYIYTNAKLDESLRKRPNHGLESQQKFLTTKDTEFNIRFDLEKDIELFSRPTTQVPTNDSGATNNSGATNDSSASNNSGATKNSSATNNSGATNDSSATNDSGATNNSGATEDSGALSGFISNFILSSSQASEDELDVLLRKEINKICGGLPDKESSYVLSKLLERLQIHRRKGIYFFKSDTEKVLNCSSAEAEAIRRGKFKISYDNSFIKDYFDSFPSKTGISEINGLPASTCERPTEEGCLFMLVSASDSTEMCTHALNQRYTVEATKRFSIRQLLQTNVQVLLKNGENDYSTLLVDCADYLAVDAKSAFQFIKELRESKPSINILLEASDRNSALLNLAIEFKIEQKIFNCDSENITHESQDHFMESYVNFQGNERPVYALTRELKNCLDIVAMSQLARGETIKIGEKINEPSKFYIPRALIRSKTIKSSVFTQTADDIKFAISGLSIEEARKYIQLSEDQIKYSSTVKENENAKVFIVDGSDSRQIFNSLAKTIPKVHWLESKRSKYRGKWIWKDSSGDISDIFSHFDANEKLEGFRTNNIEKYLQTNDNKIVVVTADPGMGKSTLLQSLSYETKQLCPEMWVISVYLRDWTNYLRDDGFNKRAEDNLKHILMSSAGILKGDSKFPQRLFEYYYTEAGNMTIFLDGFDEIVQDHKDQVLAMLHVLRKSSVARIWITTRTIMKEQLQVEFSTVAFTMPPISSEKQKLFLTRYWREDDETTIKNCKLEIIIDEVLESIQSSINDFKTFTGNPLQLKMIEEVYNERVLAHINDGTPIKPIGKLELYQSFMDKKLEIMADENIGVSHCSLDVKSTMMDKQRCFLTELALILLLPANELLKISPRMTNSEEELKEQLREGKEKAGVVLSFDNETPRFLHRTFAEYLVATFFAEHYKTNRNFLSSGVFKSDSFNLVRYFFNRILCSGFPLHEAILDKDLDAFLKALGGSTFSKRVDILKELQNADSATAIQFIAMPPQETRIQISPNAIRFIAMPPLETSIQKSPNAITVFVDFKDQAIMSKEIESKDKGGRTVLHLAASTPESSAIIRFLLGLRADANLRDSMEWNALDYAEKSKSVVNIAEIVEYHEREARTQMLIPTHVVPITCESIKTAVASDYLSLLRHLLDSNITSKIGVNVLPKYKWHHSDPCEKYTILHLSAAYNAVRILHFLLNGYHRDSKIWQIELEDQSGRTPIAVAATHGHVNAVRALLSAGAKLPMNIAQLAVRKHNHHLFELLIQTCRVRKTKPNWFSGALATLVADKSVWALSAFLRLVASIPKVVDVRLSGNESLLAASCRKGNMCLVNILCRLNANVNEVCKKGKTILHLAVMGGHYKIVECLLKCKNIKIEACDSEGYTPLYFAALGKHWNIHNILFARGAKKYRLFNGESVIPPNLYLPSVQEGMAQAIEQDEEEEEEKNIQEKSKHSQGIMYDSIERFFNHPTAKCGTSDETLKELTKLCAVLAQFSNQNEPSSVEPKVVKKGRKQRTQNKRRQLTGKEGKKLTSKAFHDLIVRSGLEKEKHHAETDEKH